MSEEEIEYLDKHKNILTEFQKSDAREANESSREGIRQLILVATVIISFSAFVVDKDNLNLLDIDQKRILFFIWISLIVSIVCGIVQILIDYLHFKKWAETTGNIIKDIVDKKTNRKNLNNLINKHYNNLKAESSVLPFYLQVISMAVALLLIILFLYILLF